MPKISASRGEGRRSKKKESNMGSLDMPSAPVQQAGPTQHVQSGQVVQSSQGHVHHDLSQHEIRDKVAHGGISDLELQHKLQTDVFMTDLDRSTYMESRAHLQPAAQKPSLEQVQADSMSLRQAAPQQTPQNLAVPPTDVFTAKGSANLQASSGPAFHSQPLGGHNALGAEGSLAPQGILKPQGFMTQVGMLGFVKGLMGIRSDGARPGSMTPKQNNVSKSAYQPVQQQQQQRQQSSATQPSAGNSRGGQQQAPAQQARPAQQQSPQAGQGGASQAYSPVQSQYESGQAFQPVQNGPGWFSQALWGNKHNPWAELLNRLFALIKKMLGQEQGGGGGGKLPPHLRGGGGH